MGSNFPVRKDLATLRDLAIPEALLDFELIQRSQTNSLEDMRNFFSCFSY